MPSFQLLTLLLSFAAIPAGAQTTTTATDAVDVLESALSSICSENPTYSGCSTAASATGAVTPCVAPGDTVVSLCEATSAATLQTFTIASGLVASGDASTLMIGTTTLTVGGPAYTAADGVTASLASSGVLSVAGTTTTLPTPSAPVTVPVSLGGEQTFTLATSITAVGDASSLVVGSTTLTPGAVYTTGSLTVSLGTSGIVDVNGASSTLPSVAPQTTSPDQTSTQTYSIAPGIILTGNPSAVVFGSTTLTPGGPPATSGTDTISLGSSGILVVDGTTTSLPAQDTAPPTITTASSTMTTIPPGLSLETWSGSQPTTNEWLTTTDQSSSTTVVPVIVPCVNCDAIIVWGILPIGIDFEWPQFPQLPKFRLPCLINCGSPPVNDGPPKSPDPTTDQQTTETTQTSTSNAVGVETQVIEIIQVSLDPTVVDGSSTTLATTQTSDTTTLDTQYTSGIATQTTTTTITGSVEEEDFTIPTPVYDDYNTDAGNLQVIMSIVSAGMAAEDAIDSSTSESATSTATTASPSDSPTTSPTTATAAATPTSNPDYHPDSDACVTCGSNLGASSCKPDDGQCLTDQCNSDDSCKQCQINCLLYDTSGLITDSPGYDPGSQAALDCGNVLAASTCEDNQCMADQCSNNQACKDSNIDCSLYA